MSNVILYQMGTDPFNSEFQNAHGMRAFILSSAFSHPNPVLKLSREAFWSTYYPTIRGPENSYFYFGPGVTPGYVMYANNPTSIHMTHLARVKNTGSNSRYFTALSGKEYKWRVAPHRMECIDVKHGTCLAVWETLSFPERKFHARLTLSASALGLIMEIMTTLALHRISMSPLSDFSQ